MLSAALPAAAAWSGLRGQVPWTVWLLVVVAVAQGLAAGLLLPEFLPADSTAEDDSGAGAGSGTVDSGEPVAPRWARRLSGAGSRYLVFLAAVVFGAVEAHAVGAGIARGAPRPALLLLVPPAAVAAWALRRAVRERAASRVGGDDRRRPEAAGGAAPGRGPGTPGETRSIETGGQG